MPPTHHRDGIAHSRTTSILPEPDRQAIQEVQHFLQALGYRPGAVGGIGVNAPVMRQP